VPPPQTAIATPKGVARAAAALRGGVANIVSARGDRRRQLFARGLRIGATQAVAARIAQPKLAGSLHAVLKRLASEVNISAPTILSYRIETPPAAPGTMLRGIRGGTAAMPRLMGAPSAFHIVTGSDTEAATPAIRITAVVAKEVGGEIVSYREMHSR
jgi:hypothetical protein